MRILHVFDHSLPLHSGYTFRSRALIREQHALGWETCHLTSSKHGLAAGSHADVEVADGLTFHRTAPPSAAWSRLPGLNQWAIVHQLERRLRELIPELRPDLIHAHSPALNGLAATRAGRAAGVPVVYEVRGFWEDAAVSHGTAREGSARYRLGRALESQALRRADAVTCICEGIRGDLISRGIAEDKISVIPNGVDVSRFPLIETRDEQLATELGLGAGPVLGFIGSFYHYEGLSLILDAMPQIAAAHPEVRLLLVGGGPMEASLREQVARDGLRDRVIFTGRVPNDEVARYYSVIDLLLYPRLPMRITELVTPLKPLEAMAQGRIFAASAVGGHRELVRDGETGRLFEAGSAEGLADVALDILANRDDWERYRRAGREFVERERTWARSIEPLQALYPRLLDKRR